MKTNNLYPDENESVKIRPVEITVRIIGESDPSDKKTRSLPPIRKETMINDDEAITIRTQAAEVVKALNQGTDQKETTSSNPE